MTVLIGNETKRVNDRLALYGLKDVCCIVYCKYPPDAPDCGGRASLINRQGREVLKVEGPPQSAMGALLLQFELALRGLIRF